MKSPKKILAVTNNFPTTRFPEKGVFVMNILKEMHRQGAQVDVIAPVSIGSVIKRLGKKPSVVDFGGLKVRRPYYFIIPNRFPRFRKIVTHVNNRFFGLSLRIAFNKKKNYDFVYCHFLHSAIPLLQSLRISVTPILVNIGESNPKYYEFIYSKQMLTAYLNRIDYIVSVSKINYDYILSLDTSLYRSTKYIPNGVDINFFKPYDKITARKKLGLDLNAKYIVFCGHFIVRKGPLRVLEAIKGTEIKGIFLGSNGPDIPIGKEVAFRGSVSNIEIAYYLSASDAFVLPSFSEGMSNAILEAMACCTPMVVSNLRFNTDFIPKNCAIFVNPYDIESIKDGIFSALDDRNNNVMRRSLSLLRENISIEVRIKRIFNFVFGS
jgi:teichuronic acid biosynthesis glycosyltransferase TuaC